MKQKEYIEIQFSHNITKCVINVYIVKNGVL